MTSGGYNEMSGDNGGRKKKKVAIIGLSSIVLVAMVVAVTVGVTRGGGKASDGSAAAPEISTSTKAIQSICQPTDYRETCEKSLSVAGNTTDPKELVKVAFRVAVNEIKVAINNSTILKELVKDPKSSQSLQNCRELLEYSIDDLLRSFDKIGSFDMSNVDELLDELNVWLSGSLTFQTTCLDQFENRTDDAGEKMKKILKTSRELTINGLNIVTNVGSILSSLQIPGLNRRLLSHQADTEYPSWITAGQRRVLQETAATIKPNLIVAKDGSGKYKTINEALKDIPLNSKDIFVVYVKEGVYDEIVTIPKDMNNVVFIGDGPTKSKVTGSLNKVDGTDTFMTATFAAIGDHFMVKDMGFENTAGAIKRQAVALRIQSHRAIVYNCQIDGYQDTLYAHAHQQFYRDCTISGTTDFIIGNARAILQNCKLIVRKPQVEDNKVQCFVTASGREFLNQTTAIVLQNCSISASPEYLESKEEFGLETYLGRPWKPLSRVIVMQSQLGDIVNPLGWIPWTGDSNTADSFLAEYGNRGPGSATTKRATWPGVKKITKEEVSKFTVGELIHGDKWIKSSGVPYDSGLIAGL